MERYFAPVGPSLPAAERVLLLAPHADDEVFGCGGLLGRLAEAGAAVDVVVVTRPRDDALAATRAEESAAAAAVLGYPAPEMWDFFDGTLADAAAALTARVAAALEALDPDLLLAPSPWEMHRDHRAVAEAALAARRGQADGAGRLGFYEVGQPLQPNTLVDITQVRARKRAAMEAFASQRALQDYVRHIDALNAFRTYSLPSEVQAAEALLILEPDEIEPFASRQAPDRLSATLWHAEREVARFGAENARLNGEIERLADDILTLQADARRLFEEKTRLSEDLGTVLGSLSWRLTRPLRLAGRAWRTTLKHPTVVGQRAAQRLPGPLRAGLKALRQRRDRLARALIGSPNNAPLLQALVDRRLAELDRLDAGWVARTATAPAGGWPPVLVSVVTYNSARWLDALMDSLLAQAYPLDRLALAFTDNGSTDDTLAVIERLTAAHGARFAGVQVHRLPNPGFGAAHNHAARHGGGAYILVTNPDLRFDRDAIVRLVAMAEADAADVACWEPRQRPYEHPKHYDPVTWETTWCSHACVLLRRAAFDAVGGYDDRLFLYGEDVELSFRLREAGWRLRYCPVATVQHDTYREAHEVKPAQYLGSLTGNLFVRLRHGTATDALVGGLLALRSLTRGPFKGARRALLGRYIGLLRRAPTLWRENRAGGRGRVGVFRGFDYELIRHGAFVAIDPPEAGPGARPLVSVVTRTYRGRAWLLRQAGLSVLQQTWPALEWIVVEDGGETARPTVEALAAAAPCPVRFLSQDKRGRSAAGNLGLAAARGRWCLFLDDDDLLYADHVETLVAALRRDPALVAAYALAWAVPCDLDPDGPAIAEHAYVQDAGHIQVFDRAVLSVRNYIPIQAILFERRLFEARGGLDERLDHLEDWNLWRRYAHGQRFALVRKTTSLYRTPADPGRAVARQGDLDAAYRRVRDDTDRQLAMLNPRLPDPAEDAAA